MGSISQLFILSGRGDTIIAKEFRGDMPKTTAETFFRKVKFWKGEAPPVFVRFREPGAARRAAPSRRPPPLPPPPPTERRWY